MVILNNPQEYNILFSITMVKERISATVDKKTIRTIKKILERGKFRNKSHVIEEAIKFFEKKHGK